MRQRRRRRSIDTGAGRQDTGAGAAGGAGLLGWARKHIVGGIIGAALVASVSAWLGGFFDSALRDILPSGADTFCAFRETVEHRWPFADPPAASDRFKILIATIDRDDADRTYTRAVARAFLKQDGIDRAETCRVLRLSGVGRGAGMEAAAIARELLQRRRADLLIGGELLKKDEAVNLWFVAKDTGQGFEATAFRLDANLLKQDFVQAASTQLQGVALAAIKPATEESGKYLVGILKPVAERLQHLLKDATGFSQMQRAELQHALGLVLGVVGEQGGDKQALIDATMAFRAALKEWTRQRVPLQWAMAQNNLGTALMRLGERESGSERLMEAVAAYRAALTEYTRERVPLHWALTQENLAIVFQILATRAAGEARKARLAEALAAVDDALAVYREGAAAYYIEKAALLRAAILAEQRRVPAR